MGSWFVPQGMLSVLVPWLVEDYLALGGARYFGIAYMLFTLPTVLFVLLGGLVADRWDARALLAGVQGALGLLALAAGVAAFFGHLDYGVLLFYLFMVGTSSAFVRPARDTLLTPVAGVDTGPPVQRLVAASTGTQFGVQLLGFGAAALVEPLGVAAMFAMMAATLLAGALAATRLPAVPSRTPRGQPTRSPVADVLRAPVRALRAAPGLTPVMVINLVVGVCYTGAYFVVVPALVLGFEGAGATSLALANFSFMGGTLAATAMLLRGGGLPGRHVSGMLAALVMNGGALLTISLASGLGQVVAGMCVWGFGTGVSIALGRTIVQERSPPSMRARLLALYTMTFLLGTPLGSLAMGFLAGAFGARQAGIGAAAATTLMLLVIAVATDLRRADGWSADGRSADHRSAVGRAAAGRSGDAPPERAVPHPRDTGAPRPAPAAPYRSGEGR